MFPCIFRAENLVVVPHMEYNLAINLSLHVDVWHTFKRYVQIKVQCCQYTEHMLIKNIWRMFLKALYTIYTKILWEKPNLLYFGTTLKMWTALLRCYFERLDDIFVYTLTYQKPYPKINATLLDQLSNCLECMVFQMPKQFNLRIIRKKKKLTLVI